MEKLKKLMVEAYFDKLVLFEMMLWPIESKAFATSKIA